MNAEQRQELGSQVESARKMKGWYQAELARRAGVSVNTVRAVEKGGSTAAGTLRKVFEALDLHPEVEGKKISDYPADVQLVMDLIGMYLVALPEGERAGVAHDLTRFLMARGQGS